MKNAYLFLWLENLSFIFNFQCRCIIGCSNLFVNIFSVAKYPWNWKIVIVDKFCKIFVVITIFYREGMIIRVISRIIPKLIELEYMRNSITTIIVSLHIYILQSPPPMKVGGGCEALFLHVVDELKIWTQRECKCCLSCFFGHVGTWCPNPRVRANPKAVINRIRIVLINIIISFIRGREFVAKLIKE